MTELTKDKDVGRKEAGLQSFLVGTDVIYKGAMVCLDVTGYLVAAADIAGYRFVGVAYEKVDNASGAPGAKTCRVYTQGVFKLVATGITQAMVGKPMYVKDDQTFDDTSDNVLGCGVLVEFIDQYSGWVDIGQRDILTGYQDHLQLRTDKSDKCVKINCRTYTDPASIIAAQSKPRAGVAMTDDIIGHEFEPGIDAGFASTKGILGIKAAPVYRLSATALGGNINGDIRCVEAQLGGNSAAIINQVEYTSSRTIGGVMSCLKAINDVHAAAVTGGIYVIYALASGGNKAWSGFANLPNDGQIAGQDDATGWIKVKIGTKTGIIAVTSMA